MTKPSDYCREMCPFYTVQQDGPLPKGNGYCARRVSETVYDFSTTHLRAASSNPILHGLGRAVGRVIGRKYSSRKDSLEQSRALARTGHEFSQRANACAERLLAAEEPCLAESAIPSQTEIIEVYAGQLATERREYALEQAATVAS